MEDSVLTDLLQPQAYPEPTAEVHLLQTHVSFLFITDSFVYKIKKPVDLGFLNFTTLDRRRFYCDEEVRLNRRLCPDMYLGVVEVRESPTGCRFFGTGAIIDYAVKMKRLPEQKMLHRLLAANAVTTQDMRQVGATIARFHLAAERSAVIAAYGDVQAIQYNWEENFQQLAPYNGVIFSDKDLDAIKSWGGRFLTEKAHLFAARVTEGFIRDCDGDIHLDNICLTEPVCIFDCIEFNNRFRYSDTAADIAFLLMDLDFHGRSDLGEAVLEEYLRITEDRGALQLIPFYKTYRAVVRSKVESFRLNDPLIAEEDKNAARNRGKLYFRLARRYVLHNRLPLSLVITCGLMGSGKSTVAAALSLELGAEAYSSDSIRKEITGVPEHIHDYSGYGQGIYTAGADRSTYNALLQQAVDALSRGSSVIVDATFRRKNDRREFESMARKHGADFHIILAACSEELARERLEQRVRQPGEISDGRWELYHRQQSEFENPSPDEGHLIFVDTSRPINDTIDTILEEMGLFS